mmetsp:Transcript_128067/g.362514  ORF Transcript_128067/g.362514 Transcript_128067/m.362514 type:complete len:219 (-) Transcript_128067:2-658(-)
MQQSLKLLFGYSAFFAPCRFQLLRELRARVPNGLGVNNCLRCHLGGLVEQLSLARIRWRQCCLKQLRCPILVRVGDLDRRLYRAANAHLWALLPAVVALHLPYQRHAVPDVDLHAELRAQLLPADRQRVGHGAHHRRDGRGLVGVRGGAALGVLGRRHWHGVGQLRRPVIGCRVFRGRRVAAARLAPAGCLLAHHSGSLPRAAGGAADMCQRTRTQSA